MIRELLLWLWLGWLSMGCASTRPAGPARTAGQATVVWLSIDGLRHDYVDRDIDRLPTLSALMGGGYVSRQLVPTFPSVTFSSHVSQVTGVPVDRHGITGNSFYDSRTQTLHRYPDDSSLIEAEPIWVTASKRGVRSATIQWPMSHKQAGAFRADYFDDAFMRDSDDAARLDRLLQTWRGDDRAQHAGRPLRLLMGYLSHVDTIGHRFGPDSKELGDTLVETDRLLADFVAEAKRLFERDRRHPDDRLWILITSDHGMSPAKGTLALSELFDRAAMEALHVVFSGPIAHVFFDAESTAERAAVEERLRADSRFKVHRRDELPPHWRFAHPSRTGDLVLVLPAGWSWSTSRASSGRGGTRGGTHGHAVEDDPNMMGLMILSSPGTTRAGEDMGRVDAERIHRIVLDLLDGKSEPRP